MRITLQLLKELNQQLNLVVCMDFRMQGLEVVNSIVKF